MAQMESELEDLGNLFDFGDIDLNNMPGPQDYGDQLQHQDGTRTGSSFQSMSEAPSITGISTHSFGGHEQFDISRTHAHPQQQEYMRSHEKLAPSSGTYNNEPVYQPSTHQMYHHQHAQNYHVNQQQIYPHSHHVPPTPTSLEMHGETARYMPQFPMLDSQQQAALGQSYSVHKDSAIVFTPMVSPVNTPQYSMLPEFTTPGAYFSPLTSPMLHAQIQQQAQLHLQQQHQGYGAHPNTAASSTTNSPIDPGVDLDMLGEDFTLPSSAGPQPRKSKRKVATPRTLATSIRTSSSTTQKQQKRKSTALSANIPTSSGDNASYHVSVPQPGSGRLQVRSQPDSSEAESISPEALSETVMGPPPRPSSSLKSSPNIIGQQYAAATMSGPAATPKSLLTMRTNQNSANSPRSIDQNPSLTSQTLVALEDLSLPEAAKPLSRRPSLAHIDTRNISTANYGDTPRISARKTPKLGPLSTPTSARPVSAINSPAITSPTTASTPSGILDPKGVKGGRGSKKRGSMSASNSKLVSPALVPKISPSIKPLLPEGTPLNSAQQALLLASKSNYQNLVEGNRLPGVNYPDSLSTGLTSKRTSHKVAEQGRRNRINDALKEMQSLIPRPASLAKSPSRDADMDGDVSPEIGALDKADEVNGKESKEESNAKSSNSKAATVELANEYIKKMQDDHAQLKRENEELKRKLAEKSVQSNTESPEEQMRDT